MCPLPPPRNRGCRDPDAANFFLRKNKSNRRARKTDHRARVARELELKQAVVVAGKFSPFLLSHRPGPLPPPLGGPCDGQCGQLRSYCLHEGSSVPERSSMPLDGPRGAMQLVYHAGGLVVREWSQKGVVESGERFWPVSAYPFPVPCPVLLPSSPLWLERATLIDEQLPSNDNRMADFEVGPWRPPAAAAGPGDAGCSRDYFAPGKRGRG